LTLDIPAEKAAMREDAARWRAAVFGSKDRAAATTRANERLLEAAAPFGGPVSAYLAIRSELDPLPAMTKLAGQGVAICVPVILGKGLALAFRAWTPGCATEPGPFGAPVPVDGAPSVPRVVVAPLLAFDRRGGRLGYGGGYYDRTIATLRAQGPVTVIGFGFAAQEVDSAPCGPQDARLDLIVTEAETIAPDPPSGPS
jgi:5-formyltetrahydrofolate cyclo-ligase